MNSTHQNFKAFTLSDADIFVENHEPLGPAWPYGPDLLPKSALNPLLPAQSTIQGSALDSKGSRSEIEQGNASPDSVGFLAKMKIFAWLSRFK